jgi:hypothetical protein
MNKGEDKLKASLNKEEGVIEDIDLSSIDINLSDNNQKPNHLD